MEENNKRVRFLDIARGIAIIMMVAGHADTSGTISNFVNLFHMMVFIFISGYLFKNIEITSIKQLIRVCIKKIKKIYIFYLFWEIVNYLFRNIFFKIGFLNTNIIYGGKIIYPIKSIEQLLKDVFKIIIGMGREPFCGAFWFLITLIFITILFSIINYVSNKFKEMKKYIECALSVSCFLIGVIMFYTVSIPRFSPAFTLILIYYFGNLYYKNKEIIKFNNRIIAIIGIIVLIILNSFR